MSVPIVLAVGGLAATATALLVRRAPALLAGTFDRRDLALSAPLDDGRQRQYARWFVHMRWVAVLLALVLVLGTVELGFLPREVLWPLLLSVAVLAASNGLYGWLLARQPLRAMLPLQLYEDLGLLVVMLHLSGGIENPLYLLPIFNVVLGGIVLTRRQSFVLAVAGSLLCTAGVWAEWARLLPHYTLTIVPHGEHGAVHVAYDARYVAARIALQVALLILTAHFVSRLAEQAGANARGLAAAAERARTGQELLEEALERTGTGLRVSDRDERTLLFNAQWRRWFPGGSPAEASVLAWAQADGSPPRRTLGDSSVRRTEVSAVPPEGEGRPRTYLVTTAPLHDREGRTDRVVELVQDVTAEKDAQARMLAASRLAAVGEVAGKLAHEINNPVGIVSAKARILLADRRAEMSDKVAHELDRIVGLADRVAGIAKGLLAYGRPSAAPRSRIDLRAPARRALSLVEEQAARQGVRLVDELGRREAAVDASGSEMEQVFLNLCLNALDTMPAGGVLALLARAATLDDGRPAVEIVVSDTGPGIPPDLRDRVFEPFFTTKTEGRGSGLGLSICQGIVRAHGGEIQLEAGVPARGARFAVRLPAVRSNGGEDSHG